MKLALYLAAPGSRFWTASAPASLAEAIACAAALGYDAIEVMPRAIDDPDPQTLAGLAARHGLAVAAVASGFIAIEYGLTLTHPSLTVRRRAVAALRQCLEMAHRLQAPLVSIGVIRGKVHPGLERARALDYLLACLREVGPAAAERGVVLAVEPGNRYETDFIHTTDEGIALLEAAGVPSIRLMLDTFHMNIEEPSLPAAIHRAAPYLAHLHVADSNRRAPGWGHLDFVGVARALRAIGYRGTIGLEMALVPDVEAAARQGARFVRQVFAGVGCST